jgi:hypothetical protein
MPCRRRRRILTQVQLKTDHHAKINHGTALRIVNRIFSVIALVAIMLPKVAGGQQESAPAGASPQHNPGLFVDATAAKGLNFRYLSSHTSKKYLVETMGAGVALFDYDNDGCLDIFLVNGAPIADPMPKGTVPNKTGSQYWNRAVPPEARRNVRRSDRESGPARRGLRDGSGRRRLRQRRLRRSLRDRLRRQPALPQQWERHVHRCYGPSGRRRWWMVNQRGLD